MHRGNRRSAVLGSFIVALLLAMGVAVGFGGSAVRAKGLSAHPAHIHTGLCPAPGDVVFPLTDVAAGAGAAIGAPSAILVETSVTTVKSALKDLTDGNHAIVVHESKENIGAYIACGDIGGEMMGSSDLAVGLGALNDSGYNGVATLHDNGDGTTAVTVLLAQSSMARGSEGATPEASPAADSASAAMTVNIKGFAYEPAAIDVAVGTTVTWTNNDSVPHTVTQDGGGFASPVINSGESFSHTFDKAGTFAYHCEYHANMLGTITVK